MNIQEMGDLIKVTIPKNREDTIPLTFSVNGESVTVPRGEEVTIPAMFAGAIKNWWKAQFYKEPEEEESGGKRILLFKDVEFSNTSKTKDLAMLGIKELVDNLKVNRDNYVAILDKYRMIFFIDNTQKSVMECDPPMRADSGTNTLTNFIEDPYETPRVCVIAYNSAYGGCFSLYNLPENKTVKVTCYLEEL